MKEYLTPAIVLGSKPAGERDRLVDLYTKDLGRLSARVVGGLRLNSKLSPHLDSGNFVDVRLVYKNQFTVTDVVARSHFRGARFFRDIFSIKSLLPEQSPDLRLWHEVVNGFKASGIKMRNLLKISGYDPILAECEGCGIKQVAYFHPSDQSFLCLSCCRKFRVNSKRLVRLD